MPDLIHSLLRKFSHDRYTALFLTVAVALSVWLVGCESTTASLDGTGPVTRNELQRQEVKANAALQARLAAIEAEIQAHKQQVGLATEDLDRQDAFRAQLVDTLGGIGVATAQGALNPAAAVGSVVTLASALLAGGTLVDNRRKDKLISTRAGV